MIADAVLVVHALFVLFVVGDSPLILAGARRWSWVRNGRSGSSTSSRSSSSPRGLLGVTCP